MVHIIGSNHMLVILLSSNVIIITFGLKKIEIDPCSIHLFSICAICKFWNWRIGFIEPREEDPLAMTSVRNYFDGKNIRKLRLRRTDSGDDIWKANLWELPQRKRKKAPTIPPHKNWLKKVPLLCLKGYKSMKWDFRRAVIDACNYFHACPNSTGCLDIAYTTHAPTTAGATEILPQIQISS